VNFSAVLAVNAEDRRIGDIVELVEFVPLVKMVEFMLSRAQNLPLLEAITSLSCTKLNCISVNGLLYFCVPRSFSDMSRR